MTKLARRKLPPPPDNDDAQDDATSAAGSPQEGIPPHVWQTLQQAGEEGAQRLLELLQPSRFHKLAGSVQRALIDLSLTRAYGLPVRRAVSVNLNSDDSDAVAASLIQLRDSLPERRAQPRDVTPEGQGPRHSETATYGQHSASQTHDAD